MDDERHVAPEAGPNDESDSSSRRAVIQGFFSDHRRSWLDRYHDAGFDAHNYRRRAEIAVSYLDRVPKGRGRLLELGCGAGVQADALHQLGWTVTATDYTVPLLQQAQQEFSGPAWVAAAAEDLPFAEATFDVVVMLGVIGYVSDPAVVLDRVRRVLVPGGYLVISCAREHTLMESVSRTVSAVPDRLYMAAKRALVKQQAPIVAGDGGFYVTYNRFWDRDAFTAMLTRANFSAVRADGVNFGQFRFMDRALWSERGDVALSSALERMARVPGLGRLSHFTRTHVVLARRD